eukprot:TRINITY_DN62127_c0_g1_i1.p1 TRINITY_DN62127_c0_g1~~TRINITY_DN62127_c0_g1_i1.p1  ORF type:complete len:232 (+),score=27.98 TRINITY_DN62127_c0_g1_i1:45-740(+)
MLSQMTTASLVEETTFAGLCSRSANTGSKQAFSSARADVRKSISQLHTYHSNAMALSAVAMLANSKSVPFKGSCGLDLVGESRAVAQVGVSYIGSREHTGVGKTIHRGGAHDFASRTRALVTLVGSSVTSFSNNFKRPRVQRRAGAQEPVVPFWLVCVALAAFVAAYCLTVVWPFMATPNGVQSAWDPPPRACGQKTAFGTRMFPTLPVALVLCSGAAVVHPLQSGLALSV